MKKIAALLCLSILLLSSSCVNDDDTDFDTIGQTFDITDVNFNQGNNFAIGFTFPQTIFDSDGVLVYRLEEVVNGSEVWEPLPTGLIFPESGGELLYRFNYTRNDVDILIESPDFTILTDQFTQNQVFRIIVVPSAFSEDPNFDISDIDDVLSKLNIENEMITKVSLD